MKRKMIVAGLLAILGLYLLAMTASQPKNIGVQNGALADLPNSPNAVSTQTENPEAAMPALNVRHSSNAEAIAQVAELVKDMPRTHIVKQTENYLHAEFTSLIFRFVDDVEFYADQENGVIHFRSASRVGHSDLGANRKRMETFTHKWNLQ